MTERPAMSVAELRAYDAAAIAAGTPGIVLMENAARGVIDALFARGVRGPVAVVCGKGNNAGDGFVVARLLHERGIPVSVEMLMSVTAVSGDAAIALARLPKAGIEVHPYDADPSSLANRLKSAEWVVDALLGTGTSGSIRPPFDAAIDAINRSGTKVLAVDLPSGMDADARTDLGPCVLADLTVTFVAPKLGSANPESRMFTGEVVVVDIL